MLGQQRPPLSSLQEIEELIKKRSDEIFAKAVEDVSVDITPKNYFLAPVYCMGLGSKEDLSDHVWEIGIIPHKVDRHPGREVSSNEVLLYRPSTNQILQKIGTCVCENNVWKLHTED